MSSGVISPADLERPLYNFSEADRLAILSAGTAKRWLEGYRYVDPKGRRISLPPVDPERVYDGIIGVSFVALIELVAIGKLRGIGFSLSQVRSIVRNCAELFDVRHPLASMQFKTDGKEVFVGDRDRLIEVGRRKGAQAWNEILEPFLDTLDYRDELQMAYRWWPLGRDKRIVVDPAYGFGLPVVVESGVRTETILEQFRAGELRDDIAADFNVGLEDVERALQFEAALAAA